MTDLTWDEDEYEGDVGNGAVTPYNRWPPTAPDWYGARGDNYRPPPAPQNPYIRWGDTLRVRFGALQTLETREFQRIELPRPALCRVTFHVDVQPTVSPGASVEFTSITYIAGVGSSSSKVNRVYLDQPQVPTALQPFGTSLDVEWYIPIERMNARISARAVNCIANFTLALAPVALEDLRQG